MKLFVLPSAAVCRVAAAVAVLCATAAPSARGQHEPFSRVEITGGPVSDVGSSRIHHYWKPGYGGEVSLFTPFYLGYAEAGAAYHRYDVAVSTVPRFDALLVFAGWGMALEPVHWLSWYNGFRIGNSRMTFDEETFPGVQNESEFLLGGQSRLTLRVYKRTGLFGAVHLTQTYTYVRMRTTYVSFGVTTSFSSPSWLRTALR